MNYIYSIIPTIIIAIFIYKLDKHKEPLKLLIELFIGGILSTFIVLLLTISLRLIYPNITIINNSISSIRLFINIFITIGIIEEFSKWIITYKISYNHAPVRCVRISFHANRAGKARFDCAGRP